MKRPLRPATFPNYEVTFGRGKRYFEDATFRLVGWYVGIRALCYCSRPEDQEDPDAQQDEGFPPEEWIW